MVQFQPKFFTSKYCQLLLINTITIIAIDILVRQILVGIWYKQSWVGPWNKVREPVGLVLRSQTSETMVGYTRNK